MQGLHRFIIAVVLSLLILTAWSVAKADEWNMTITDLPDAKQVVRLEWDITTERNVIVHYNGIILLYPITHSAPFNNPRTLGDEILFVAGSMVHHTRLKPERWKRRGDTVWQWTFKKTWGNQPN